MYHEMIPVGIGAFEISRQPRVCERLGPAWGVQPAPEQRRLDFLTERGPAERGAAAGSGV